MKQGIHLYKRYTPGVQVPQFHLEQVGFENVERKSFGECSDPKLCLDLQERAWESLYVEAQKNHR